MSKAAAALDAAVPRGKALVWLVGVGLVVYSAGWGSALRFSAYRNLPVLVAHMDSTHMARLDSISGSVGQVRAMADANTSSISTTRLEVASAQATVFRMLCLVEIAVQGQTLTPFEIERRCPSSMRP